MSSPGWPVPAELDWLTGSDEGRRWLAALPDLISAAARRWSVEMGDPYRGGRVSYVAPATAADGGRYVVKITWPHPEAEHEPAALAVWDGDHAIKLLDDAADLGAMLVERCDPGTPLSTLHPEAALDVLVDLLPRLWVPAGEPFTTLADAATGWAEGLVPAWERAGRPFERRLVDLAIQRLQQLGPTGNESVLLHQDLHADNVLAASRMPWLAIDPKPLVGERAFGLAPIIRGRELGHGREAVLHRLDRLTAQLCLDRQRAIGWTIGHTLAWGFDDGQVIPDNIDVVRWLADA